ncbi:uncharacterized protein [Cicer arietinum]|uniref:Uncharacterized protein LOC101499650 n=1 Tax=Cicer arietinum TaxID=3827 RepID=A0A1S2YZV5_CICAR|nr:uncharacterized protein LOC101499650 [Cicer arietinum]
MSLNCLTCSQVLQRTDSFRELFKENEYQESRKNVDRTWSGNMSAPLHKEIPKGSALAKIKADHRRNHSTGNLPFSGRAEPRLVRSSGMRRDWSFENLAEQQDQRVTCH